jgi:hypothetical protein
MKIALCLSGQPRKVLENFPNIKKYIIEPNNADVFIHLNYDKNIQYIEKAHINNGICTYPENIDNIVNNLYSPKRMLVETPKLFNNPNIKLTSSRIANTVKMNNLINMTREEHIIHAKKQWTSMYYSIYKCNELKELYANEHGFVYDYVIRLRFDISPTKILDCSKLDPNYIYYQELNQPDNLISDWINFGSNMIMNVYASVFLNAEYINSFIFFKKEDRLENTIEPSDECAGGSEFNIRDLITLFKIPNKSIDIGLTWM